ncbi:MAG: hypothetical protein R3191_03755 [Anaerolineales bacterium]|nr:hypothetical protein [Anaerolineales bacterium]
MTESPETERHEDDSSGLVYRVRPATDPSVPSLLLFHGLTGDEDVMWIVESALPGGGLVAAPRAPFEAPEGGYSWVEDPEGPSIGFDDLGQSVGSVSRWIDSLEAAHGLDKDRMAYVGFSQGAALGFALARQPGLRPGAVVCLSGFLPDGPAQQLEGLPVFWGHGSRDDTLPIERAREDEGALRDVGAEVHFCEADVGHKVGVECMRGLRTWLSEQFPSL